ncbi:hypothetical protein NBRC116493_13410 [Aurantivibrio infirmus]
MGPKTIELINELDECAKLLRGCSEDHWAQWLEKSSALLKNGHFRGIEHFEKAFGGMGSANDLILHPVNGHSIRETEVDMYNKKLKQHFDKSHKLAAEMRKNAVFEK